MEKTNAMRLLDAKKIGYTAREYSAELTDGEEVAAALKEEKERVFKTLVTAGSDKNYYVFVIPVSETLDLKKAARAAGVKSIAMLPAKRLFPLTGYVHGGCSPVGMKKQFRTFIEETAQLFDTIFCSGGTTRLQYRNFSRFSSRRGRRNLCRIDRLNKGRKKRSLRKAI